MPSNETSDPAAPILVTVMDDALQLKVTVAPEGPCGSRPSTAAGGPMTLCSLDGTAACVSTGWTWPA